MRNLLAVYGVIIILGTTSMLTKIPYFANIAGFIAAIGFMVVFFKDRNDEKEFDKEHLNTAKKMRRNWYIVFATGLFFSLIFGTFWNTQMGGM